MDESKHLDLGVIRQHLLLEGIAVVVVVVWLPFEFLLVVLFGVVGDDVGEGGEECTVLMGTRG